MLLSRRSGTRLLRLVLWTLLQSLQARQMTSALEPMLLLQRILRPGPLRLLANAHQ